jgi:hypothetical protein
MKTQSLPGTNSIIPQVFTSDSMMQEHPMALTTVMNISAFSLHKACIFIVDSVQHNKLA